LNLLGRHFKRDTKPIIYLSTKENYTRMHDEFLNNIAETPELSVSYKSFVRIWQKYLPEIQFLSPRTDLCQLCKEMRFNSTFWTSAEKEKRVKVWNEHIRWSNEERDYYRYQFKYIFLIYTINLTYLLNLLGNVFKMQRKI